MCELHNNEKSELTYNFIVLRDFEENYWEKL